MLPGVGEHSCSLGQRGGFRERLEEGTWLGHVAEHIALELQRESGAHVYRGKTRSAGEPGPLQRDLRLLRRSGSGSTAGELAVRLVNHLVKADPDFDFHAELERPDPARRATAFGPSTQAIIDEAVSRDIPWIRLNEALARPARPGQVPAADPGDDDVEDERARGRHRRRQEDDATSCSRPRVCPSRGARSCGRDDEAVAAAEPDRVPGRHEAARREPRARRRARPPDRARRAHGVPAGAAGGATRAGRRRELRRPATTTACS